MPELPEVEIVARALHRLMQGRRIKRSILLRARLALHHTPEEFSALISETSVQSVSRRGKHLLFELENGRTLITHLRMSGRFLLLHADRDDPKFTHAVFELEDNARLVFQDQRHFGMMKIAETASLADVKELALLAPEPLTEDFSPSYLATTANKSNKTVKEFLLDQTKVCGLGNIYAAEALFLARIHPEKPAGQLSRRRVIKLHDKIRFVLAEAIAAGSTLNIDPQATETIYYGGAYEQYWRVYGREGKECRVCQSVIRRLRQGGRSTYFCPRCQRR